MNLLEKYLNRLESSNRPGAPPDVPSKPGTVSSQATLGDFQSLFEKTVAEVGACYIPGTLEMIRADFPDLAGEIEAAEDRVNDLWLKARTEAVDVGDIREDVERWKTLHLRAIRFFSLMESHTGATQLSQDQRSIDRPDLGGFSPPPPPLSQGQVKGLLGRGIREWSGIKD